MKTIKKLKNNMKTVAGSALLVGATLTAGAAAVSAQDNGSSGDLGDYPAPFVNEDGEVDTTVVVGETAEDGNPVSTLDVVSAVEVAGSLGSAAFTEEEVNVDVETTGTVAGWNAENGVTLDRRNSPIFFGQDINVEENRLDDQDLEALTDTTFQSEDSEEVTVEHDVRIGSQTQGFDSDRGDVDDPVLHVENPTSPGVGGDYLMQAEVDFSDTIDFVEDGDGDDTFDNDADEYIEDGETIEMFGQDFEFSDESTTDELVFYGSSQNFNVGTNDEPETVTIDGQDHEFAVDFVPAAEDEDATVTVDGSTEAVAVGDTIDFDGTEVRVTDFFKQAGDEGLGSVEFSIGSDEVKIDDSGNVEVGGDDLDGVTTEVVTGGTDFRTVEGIKFAFGAEDSDTDMVQAGDMYEDPLFGLQFHYGGLSGDVVNNPADAFTVEASDDGATELTLTAGGEETTIQLGEATTDSSSNDIFSFGPDDEDATIAQYEGEPVTEDDYVTLNANEEAEMYEVTNVDDTDLEDQGSGTDDESVSLTLNNVVTGESVEIEEDGLDFDTDDDLEDSDLQAGLTPGDFSGDVYQLEGESINGNDFDITFHGDDRVSIERTSDDGNVQLFPWMYSQTDGAVAIDASDAANRDEATAVQAAFDVASDEFGADIEVSTAGSAGSGSVNVGYDGDDGDATVSFYDLDNEEYDVEDATVSDSQTFGEDLDTSTNYRVEVESATSGLIDVTGSGVSTESQDNTLTTTRSVEIPSGVASNDATTTVTLDAVDSISSVGEMPGFVQYDIEADGDAGVDLTGTDTGANTDGDDNTEVGVLVTEPEDDDDNEEGYVATAYSVDGGQDVSVSYTSGGDNAFREGASMDDEDVEATYDFYGAYSMLDTEDSDEDVFTLHLPAGQSSAGLAVTGADGSLSADGGSSTSSGSAMSQVATGSYGDVALDNELEGSDRTDSNLILVGGPSVNSLVSELVSENQTMPAEDYSEGEGMVQMVDGFGDHSALIVAGHSAEDTRAAGEFLADYRNNEAALEGQSQVTVSTETGQVVE